MLRAFLCFLGSLLIVPVAALAQQASPSDERLEGLDADIASMVERYEAPGLAVAVIENGEIIYTHYSGQSDIAAGQAVNGQTQFGIGSVVKSFTSGLIGTLADEGKLSLDAHPRSYLPGFPESDVPEGKRLAIRHLLTQNSGLPKMDGSLAYFVPSKRREILPRLAEFDRGCAPAVCFE
ncbi:MAG: serine hydrolase domain-containing protein, partial [Wenzhouxiangella sp.]|nr:serine hydrolase domain-containing protein [Wenzhouxiangella sp.]